MITDEELAKQFDELSEAAGNDGELDRRDVWREAAAKLRKFIQSRAAGVQPPKDATAVQIPKHPISPFCAWHSSELKAIEEYGDARAAQAYSDASARIRSGDAKIAELEAREPAARAQVVVPEGYVLVQRELSEDMSLEAQLQVAGVDDERLSEIWEAFLRTASPIPQALTAGGDGDDSARLNYLESMFAEGVHVEGCYSGTVDGGNIKRCATAFIGSKEWRGCSIREVIDAARRLKDAAHD